MEKIKTISVYFESEEVAVRITTDPTKADFIINGDGTITSTSAFKETVKKLETTSSNNPKVEKSNQLEIDISELLISIGILPNIKGYRYTIEAIKILINDPDIINSVTKDLYPKVSEIFKTTPNKVERAIRHGIEISFNRGNKEVLNRLFVLPLASGKTKSTNSEFLSGIAEEFRLKK